MCYSIAYHWLDHWQEISVTKWCKLRRTTYWMTRAIIVSLKYNRPSSASLHLIFHPSYIGDTNRVDVLVTRNYGNIGYGIDIIWFKSCRITWLKSLSKLYSQTECMIINWYKKYWIKWRYWQCVGRDKCFVIICIKSVSRKHMYFKRLSFEWAVIHAMLTQARVLATWMPIPASNNLLVN